MIMLASVRTCLPCCGMATAARLKTVLATALDIHVATLDRFVANLVKAGLVRHQGPGRRREVHD